MKLVYRVGAPLAFLSLRAHTLRPSEPAEVDEEQARAIFEELRTEFVRTVRNGGNERQEIVSSRAPGFRPELDDKCLLEFIDKIDDEPPVGQLELPLDGETEIRFDYSDSPALERVLPIAETDAAKRDELAGEVRELLDENPATDNAPPAP